MPSAVALHVEQYGQGKPTIVFLHGFAGSARNFRPQARHLRDRHRVVSFDLRGHARSAAPSDMNEYAPEAFVEDVDRVLHEVAETECVLGGISMLLAALSVFLVRDVAAEKILEGLPTSVSSH